jgi:hypothetical protein
VQGHLVEDLDAHRPRARDDGLVVVAVDVPQPLRPRRPAAPPLSTSPR